MSENSTASNGISKLYFHLLAAKLNLEHGAEVPQNVSETISGADAFLANNSEADWDDLSESDRKMVLEWKDTLDAYNNGHYTDDNCVGDWRKDDTERGDNGGNPGNAGNGDDPSASEAGGPDDNPGKGDERSNERAEEAKGR